MNVLRTPDERFASLPDFPYEPQYVTVDGLRMAYVETGEGDPILCLHGEPSWSFLYRKMMPGLAGAGRVICPDLIGFGRSEKPDSTDDYTFDMHYSALRGFVEALDLNRITLVCQDWGGLLGLPLAAELADRFARLVIMNTGLPTGEGTPSDAFLAWRKAASEMEDMPVGRIIQGATVSDLSDEIVAAYDAPYPDASYKAGAHIFPLLVPSSTDDPASPRMIAAKKVFSTWTKPALVMFSDKDPVTKGGEKQFLKLIPSAKDEPEITIHDAGHFLQEDKGEEIAQYIVEFIERRPID